MAKQHGQDTKACPTRRIGLSSSVGGPGVGTVARNVADKESGREADGAETTYPSEPHE